MNYSLLPPSLLYGAARLGVALLVIAWVATDARACQCREYGTPVCAAYTRAAAVFVGMAAEIKKVPKEKDNPDALVSVRFLVEEPFRGVAGPEIEVLTSTGHMCALPFQRGQRWLVYAYREARDGRLGTEMCTGTRQIDGAEEDLVYLRGLAKGAFQQSVSGKLRDRPERVGGIKFLVTGGGRRYESTSDANGNFTVALPEPGRYRVRAVVPSSVSVLSYIMGDMETHPTDEQTVIEYGVDLALGQCDYRELELYEIDLHATAEITGRVLDAQGQPVAAGSVHLLDAEKTGGEHRRGKHARLGTDGAYKFESLAAGRYVLVINPSDAPPDKGDAPYPRTFYPGVTEPERKTVVSVTEGAKLSGLDLQLGPPLRERRLTGRVFWADGRPAPKARVELIDGTSGRYMYSVNADGKGRFSMTVYEGFKYELVAEVEGGRISGYGEPIAVPPTSEPGPLKLVIKPAR